MRGTKIVVVDKVNVMEELSDNCRHGKTQEMVIVLGDTLEEF